MCVCGIYESMCAGACSCVHTCKPEEGPGVPLLFFSIDLLRQGLFLNLSACIFQLGWQPGNLNNPPPSVPHLELALQASVGIPAYYMDAEHWSSQLCIKHT